jgi:hypothetical protein
MTANGTSATVVIKQQQQHYMRGRCRTSTATASMNNSIKGSYNTVMYTRYYAQCYVGNVRHRHTRSHSRLIGNAALNNILKAGILSLYVDETLMLHETQQGSNCVLRAYYESSGRLRALHESLLLIEARSAQRTHKHYSSSVQIMCFTSSIGRS